MIELSDEDRTAILAEMNTGRVILFTIDQITETEEAGYRAGLRASLERAAKVCDDMFAGGRVADECAAAIRQLIKPR